MAPRPLVLNKAGALILFGAGLLAACGPDKAETGEEEGDDSRPGSADTSPEDPDDTDSHDTERPDAAPSVVIVEPLDGALLRGPVAVAAEASDDLGVVSVAFYINGEALATDAEAPFEATFATSDLGDGATALKAVATDTAGQTGEAEITVTLDNTAPELSIVSPSEGETISGTVDLEISATDGDEIAEVVLYVDGEVAGEFTEEPYAVELDTTLLSYGEHALGAWAVDRAGNEATDTILVQVDNPPGVSFTDPTDSTVGGRLTITAEATDDDLVTSFSLAEEGVVIAASTTETTLGTTLDTCALSNGFTVFYEASARDTGGNTSVETLLLTVDQPLQVEIVEPDGPLNTTATLSARVSDDESITGVVFDLDGTTVASTTAMGTRYADCFDCGCVSYSASWSTETATEGAHTLTVTVTNASGDTATDSTTIEIDYDHDGDGYDSEFYGGDDCDDTDSAESPAAAETCDGEDDDCDGALDEGFDADGDSWLDAVACAGIASARDCDDTDAAVSPDAEELCDNGVDDDCDGGDESCAYGGVFAVDAVGYTFGGEGSYDSAGYAVAGGYDANGDGFDDALIGAAGSWTGAAYLLYGPVTASGTLGSSPSVEISGAAARDAAGTSLAFVGDQDGDGNDELLIGAPGQDEGGTGAGGAYVVSGPVTAAMDLSAADAALIGVDDSDAAGAGVRDAGDVDGDGVTDLLIGARRVDDVASNAGTTYLVLGPVTADLDLSLADGAVQGDEADDAVGGAQAGRGDTNGDGYADFAVGAPNASTTDAGQACTLHGPLAGSVSLSDADSCLEGVTSGDEVGDSVGLLDADGDGYDDVVAGAPGREVASRNDGAAYIRLAPLSGSASAGSTDVTISGVENGATFGEALAACEIDDDGYDDLVVGARLGDGGGPESGTVYVFFGPLTGSLTTDSAQAVFLGDDLYDYLGWAAACAGDTDGDGLGDLLLGAFNADTSPGINAGAAYLLPFASVP